MTENDPINFASVTLIGHNLLPKPRLPRARRGNYGQFDSVDAREYDNPHTHITPINRVTRRTIQRVTI